MYIKILFLVIISNFLLSSCNSKSGTETGNTATIIIQTEKDFEKMASTKGLSDAFKFYSDENAVINRNDSLIRGRKAISDFYNQEKYNNVTLRWFTDFVDVSASNDLAYTFGRYIYTVKDSIGGWKDYTGIFHTVWKKQTDGNWKFVWD